MRMDKGAFGKYNNNRVLLTSNQTTDDIIAAIHKHHNKYKNEYDKASERFWKGDAYNTANALFDFLKNNIKYKVEPLNEQTIKSPAAIMHQSYGDCKHYASFIAGIVDSLKRKGYPIDVLYRYASYRAGKQPHHVFAVVLDEDGQEIWVDPVLTHLDQRKQYVKAIDKSAGLAGVGDLYGISGIGESFDEYDYPDQGEIGLFRGKKFKAERAAALAAGKTKKQFRKGRRAQRKEEGKGILRKAARAVKKVSFAVNRNSFLLMLKMNLFRLASKIKAKMNENPAFKEKLAKKWKAIGGNPKQLFKDIDRGVKVWNKRHKDKQISGDSNALDIMHGLNKYGWAYDAIYLPDLGFCVDCNRANNINKVGYIGVAPAIGAGAIVVAAMPVVAALLSLLKGAGIDTSNINKEGAEAEDQIYQEEANDIEEQEAQQYEDSSQQDYEDGGGGFDEYSGGYVDPADIEEDYGEFGAATMTEQDYENTGRVAAGIAKLFKRSPQKKAAAQARKASRRAVKGKAPKVKSAPRKIKVVQKAIPIATKMLPGGQPMIQQGTPVWDRAVRASHEGGPRGLTVNQGPQGGQGINDFFSQASNWVKTNPGPSLAIGAGLLFVSGALPLGKKRRR